MLIFEPKAALKLFKIDMEKFELIEDSKLIYELVGNINPKYLKLEELYKIIIQQRRKEKISSLYE
jgi:hypothetical protein